MFMVFNFWIQKRMIDYTHVLAFNIYEWSLLLFVAFEWISYFSGDTKVSIVSNIILNIYGFHQNVENEFCNIYNRVILHFKCWGTFFLSKF